MLYSCSGAQVNPQLRGSDRRVISPRRGRHTVSSDDRDEYKRRPKRRSEFRGLLASHVCSSDGGLTAACPLALGRTITQVL